MTRNILRLMLALLLIGAAYLLFVRTEWVDDEVHVPRSGEAAYNKLYALQQLIKKLGGKPEKAKNLQTWPPQYASMLLTSSHWKLFPERVKQLQDWVENGGNLVIPASMLNDPAISRWVGVRDTDDEPEEDDEAAPPASTPSDDVESEKSPDAASAPASDCKTEHCRRWQRKLAEQPADCRPIPEPDDVSPAYSNGRSYQVCGAIAQVLSSVRKPVWQVGDETQTLALRVPVGRGSISVYQQYVFFDNDRLFKGDHALIAAALLQIRPGQAVWFVDEESRPPLLTLIWDKAWVAVLLTLLALCAALWRSGVRFGPPLGQLALGRRSMAEQVKGTAQFLWQRDPEAIHAAQLRALDEAALPRIRGYGQMSRTDRAMALHQTTGLDTEALAVAMDSKRPRRAADIAPTLNLLETARRLLLRPGRQRAGEPASAPFNRSE